MSTIDANAILAALVAKAGETSIYASELAFTGGARRCDFWTISPNGSAGYKAIAYEIKVSRADFKKDSAIKQREARLFSDLFYYVTPPGLIRREEVPEWAGLIEFDGKALSYRLTAPHRCKDAPSWELIVSLIRNSGKVNRDTDLIRQRCLFAERKLREVEKRLRAEGLEPWQFGLT